MLPFPAARVKAVSPAPFTIFALAPFAISFSIVVTNPLKNQERKSEHFAEAYTPIHIGLS